LTPGLPVMVAPPSPSSVVLRRNLREKAVIGGMRGLFSFARWRARREAAELDRTTRERQVFRGFVQINLIQRPR
jgi:hypothetical protein